MRHLIVIACYTALLFVLALIMHLAARVRDPRTAIIGLRVPALMNNPKLWKDRHNTATVIFTVDAFAFCISAILVSQFYTGQAVPVLVLLTALFVLYLVLPLYWLTRSGKRTP